MEIILTQDVLGIGKSGNKIKVKDGFANNYLIPSKLAVVANDKNVRKLQQEKQRESRVSGKIKNQAEELKLRLEALSLTIPVLTQDTDKLYGSIGAAELEQALKDEGLSVDKNSILVEEPIKSLGIYEIPVKLHPEVSAKLKVWIVKK